MRKLSTIIAVMLLAMLFIACEETNKVTKVAAAANLNTGTYETSNITVGDNVIEKKCISHKIVITRPNSLDVKIDSKPLTLNTSVEGCAEQLLSFPTSFNQNEFKNIDNYDFGSISFTFSCNSDKGKVVLKYERIGAAESLDYDEYNYDEPEFDEFIYDEDGYEYHLTH